jgi:polyketide cyclase/dehydrase/lipid transport protein
VRIGEKVQEVPRRGGVRRVLERRFTVNAPLERAWTHLEKVERWPSWARHIRRIDLQPRGPLTATSEGVIHLTNGMRSTFRMERLNPTSNWQWAGPFLWLNVHYDHQFTRIEADKTQIAFIIDVERFGAAFFGNIFAAIYSINLRRAIPRLVKELES